MDRLDRDLKVVLDKDKRRIYRIARLEKVFLVIYDHPYEYTEGELAIRYGVSIRQIKYIRKRIRRAKIKL